MMLKIKCPKCNTDGSMSLLESSYHGPYRCWKCRGLFTITIDDNEVKSWEPLSEEDFEKQQQLKAMQDKLKRHD